jgi:uncharacterized protein (DUF2236 family)
VAPDEVVPAAPDKVVPAAPDEIVPAAPVDAVVSAAPDEIAVVAAPEEVVPASTGEVGPAAAAPDEVPGAPGEVVAAAPDEVAVVAPVDAASGAPDLQAPGTNPTERHGLYGPGSEAWRLNREASLLLGAGPRALLLQIAHPLVAEGVDQHSDFRTDPWGRLAGTLRSYLRIVYGTGTAARSEIERLNALHRRVTGPVRDQAAADRLGARYAARDPELSLWVHATLIDSTLATVDAWLEPLSRDQRARFYAETLVVGRLFGAPDDRLPPDIDAFDAYMASMLAPSGPVHPTPTARELASVILHPRLEPLAERGPVAARLGSLAPPLADLLRRVPTSAVDWLLVPSTGLLPAATRAEYGLPWGPRERAISQYLVAAWASWRPLLPSRWRWFPQALAADSRVAR